MEKIKSILNPGHKADDETLYGATYKDSAAAKRAEGHPTEAPTCTSEDKGLGRQILDPQDDKYDSSRFGQGDASAVLGSSNSSSKPTGSIENATAGTIPTSSDADTQYSRDAHVAEGAGATGLGAHDSSKVPTSNTEIYGSALTHPTQKNEPTSILSTSTGLGLSATNPASSNYPTSSTAQSLTNPIGSPERDSHFGRDAAVAGGVGATGLGAYEASQHHDQKQSAPAPQSTSNDGYGSAKILGTTTTGSTVRYPDTTAPGPTGTAPGQAIGSTSSKDHDSHYGRDAALAGGAGAAGLGAYEAKKHHDASSASQPIHQSTAQQLGPGAALGTGSRDVSSGSGISSVSRPDVASIASNASIKSGVLGKVPSSELTKDSANLPVVTATGGKFMDGTSSYPTQTQPQATTGDRAFPLAGGQSASSTTNPSSSSHVGRNAAVVGGTGLAGAGAYEAWKRHEEKNAPKSATSAASNVNDGRQSLAGAAAAVTKSDAREEPAEWRDHTHGGVGHEYRGDPCGPNEDNTSSGSGLPPAGPHQTQAANLLDPTVKHDSINHMPGTYPRTESDMAVPSYGGAQTGLGSSQNNPVSRADDIVGSHATSSNDRHLGRDAAVAGGVGAAGLGAYEASKKHDTTASGFGTQSSTVPSSTGVPYNSSTTGPSSTTAAPNTGLAATDSKLRDENDSHTGRNVGLGGGAAAAGLGGYEAYKHHENKLDAIPSSTTGPSSTTSAPYSSTTAPSTGETVSKLRDDNESHIGRNAALGGGAAAAGLGGYEAYKHHENKDNHPSTTVGHSTSAGAPGATGTAPGESIGSGSTKHNDKSHHGRDAAAIGGVGTAGLGAHEAEKHHDSQRSRQTFFSTNAGPSLDERSAIAASNSGATGSDVPKHDDKSHHGRDAALVGGAGATGLGAYEAKKYHDEKENIPGQQSTLTHNQKDTVPSTSTTDDKHHIGRDVAAVGAAGAAGAGAHHEYSKHEAEKLAKEQQKNEEKLAKEREHEAAKRHKEHEKEVKQHDKAVAKHEKEEEKEKKPSLISRILHRKKDKEGQDIEDEEDTRHGHGKEAAIGAGAVGAAGVAAHEHDGRNKLHKDPPAGHDSGRATRTYFTTAAGPTSEQRAEHEATLAEQHLGTAGSHATHSGATGSATTGESGGIVTDPHTGLPMNVGKYGDGHGGTDGNPSIHGAQTGNTGNVTGTDWEGIKKANTPY